jgi:hypothetical protein
MNSPQYWPKQPWSACRVRIWGEAICANFAYGRIAEKRTRVDA